MKTTTLLGLALATLLLPASARAAEICGDGADNDADNLTDEDCYPDLVSGVCESPLDCGTVGTPEPNGGLRLVRPPDLAVSVAFGPSLAFQRTYQSHYSPAGASGDRRRPMGIGFQHNFMSWLSGATVSKPTTVFLRARTGQDIRWTYQAPVVGGWRNFKPQAGYQGTLKQNDATPTIWELDNLDGTGLKFSWNSATGLGLMTEVHDSFATPNKLTVTYTGEKVLKVTDASTTRELRFTYDGVTGLLTTVALWQAGGGSAFATRTFDYVSGRMTAVKDGTTTIESYTWNTTIDRLLTVASAGSTILEYVWHADSAITTSYKQLARIASPGGGMAITTTHPGVHRLGFNQTSGSCTSDATCATGQTCGLATVSGGATTGVCYRANRTVTFTASLAYPVPDTVTGSCPTCTAVEDYDWYSGTSNSHLQLIGTKDGQGVWTSFARDATTGTLSQMVEGDTDSNALNTSVPPPPGTRLTYFKYTATGFPGLLTETRRASELSTVSSSCSSSVITGCKRTVIGYNPNGRPVTQVEHGVTLDANGDPVGFQNTTSWEYDATAPWKLNAMRGPRAGVDDDVEYTYWGAGSGTATNYLKEVKRRTGTSTYLTSTLSDYDTWGNSTKLTDSNAKAVCRTFDARFGLLASSRRVIDGSHTACGTVGGADEITRYDYDVYRRLTKTTKPMGNCTTRTYNAAGRLATTQNSDNCAGDGDTIQNTYDADGRLTKAEWFYNAVTLVRTQEYTYGPDRRLATEVNPSDTSKAKAWFYEDDGVPSEVRFEDYATTFARTEWTVDGLNRMTAEKRKSAVLDETWTITAGVQLDLPKKIEDGASHPIDLVWDDLGRKVKQVTPETGVILYVRDEAGNVTTRIENFATPVAQGDEAKLTFTYDTLGRLTAEDSVSDVSCGTGQGAEIQYTYDALPGGVSCPSGSTCNLLSERLARVKTKLACDAGAADKTLDQETFYSYDNAGRTVQHTVKDDTGRVGRTLYYYDKNSNLTYEYYPSGTYANHYYNGSLSYHSDFDRPFYLYRNTTQLSNLSYFRPWGAVSTTGYLMAFDHGGTMYLTAQSKYVDTAYRPTYSLVQSQYSTPDPVFRIDYGQDARGRITKRDFSSGTAGQIDQFFLYDDLSRVTCRSRTAQASCPTTGANLMENVSYNSSADRSSIIVKNSALAEQTHSYNYSGTKKEQIATIDINDDTDPAIEGVISFAYDGRGNRLADDDSRYTGAGDDKREYTYDARNNLKTVTGQYLFAANDLNTYVMTNAYDERNRRIFKSFKDTVTNKEAQWFYYYDQWNKLIEVVHTPDVSDTNDYSVYSWFWIEGTPVAYYQLDYVNGLNTTTSRRFLMTDEQGRPHAAWSYPTSGSSTRVWEVEAGTWGNDEITVGSGIYQPLRFPGQHSDPETAAVTSGGARLRAAVAMSTDSAGDPQSASVLQASPDTEPLRWSRDTAETKAADEGPVFACVQGTIKIREWRIARGTAVLQSPRTTETCTKGQQFYYSLTGFLFDVVRKDLVEINKFPMPCIANPLFENVVAHITGYYSPLDDPRLPYYILRSETLSCCSNSVEGTLTVVGIEVADMPPGWYQEEPTVTGCGGPVGNPPPIKPQA